MQKIGRPPRAPSADLLAQQSEQSIALLNRISVKLKLQHRHFDDAVILHCISLIKDHVQPAASPLATANTARRE